MRIDGVLQIIFDYMYVVGQVFIAEVIMLEDVNFRLFVSVLFG
jgi:hypothetical protein